MLMLLKYFYVIENYVDVCLSVNIKIINHLNAFVKIEILHIRYCIVFVTHQVYIQALGNHFVVCGDT